MLDLWIYPQGLDASQAFDVSGIEYEAQMHIYDNPEEEN